MSRVVCPRQCFTDMIDPLRYAKSAFKAAGDDDLVARMDVIQDELERIVRTYDMRVNKRMRAVHAKRRAEAT